MRTPRIIALALLSISFASLPCRAQSTFDKMTAQATTANIQSWLQSDDPILVSWGAYFVAMPPNGQPNDQTTETARLVLEKANATDGLFFLEPSSPHATAIGYLTDAMIQRKVRISPRTVTTLIHILPTDAFLLASRLPADQSAPIFQVWFYRSNGPEPEWVIRVAAMFLAKNPPPGFAATIASHTEEDLEITAQLPYEGIGRGFGSTGVCADGVGGAPDLKLPPPVGYTFQENNHSPDAELIETAGDRITWSRTAGPQGDLGCHGIRALDVHNRHHLLAAMLGQADASMSWPVDKRVSIVYKNEFDFQREVGAAVQTELALLAQTMRQLEAKGYVTPQEVESSAPRLIIKIVYHPKIVRTP